MEAESLNQETQLRLKALPYTKKSINQNSG